MSNVANLHQPGMVVTLPWFTLLVILLERSRFFQSFLILIFQLVNKFTPMIEREYHSVYVQRSSNATRIR